MKKTKIIATIGPSIFSEKKLISIHKEGVNVIRFNFSHANYEEAEKQTNLIKSLNEKGLTNFSLLLDTKGPEIRTGTIEEPIEIKEGKKYKIYVDEKKSKGNGIFCDYPYLIEDVKKGQEIIIDSGLLKVIVEKKSKDYIEVLAKNSLLLKSKRHINLPGVHLRLPGITKQDKKDIEFALKHNFDFIAASFIRNKKGIEEIRKLFEKNKNKYIQIISKIENEEAIENLDEIIKHSDGIMVARGDLGIEIPIEKLPVYQKEMVEKCKKYGKFVIIATHFLETMIESPFPTRAETSDIYNAVQQKPDCIMLSGETTIGKYPVEAVQMMKKVTKEAEKHSNYIHTIFDDNSLSPENKDKKELILHAIEIGQEINAQAVILLTKTGFLAKIASLYRPEIPVYAFTKNKEISRSINILYGITPIYLKEWEKNDFEYSMDQALKLLVNDKKISKKGKIIIVNYELKGKKEFPFMQIININEYI